MTAATAEPKTGEVPLLVGIFLVSALLLTWPLVFHLTSKVPMGSEPTPTVPYFNLWTIGRNVSFWSAAAPSYWDAPIFHPVAGAFAFADPQPLTGLLAAGLWWGGPPLAYNSMLLVFLFLDGLAVANLLRHRGCGFLPALLGGCVAQALPFLTHERGVIQLQGIFGVVWAVDNLWRLTERPQWRYGIGFGAAVVATYFTSEYYAVFLSLLLVPALLLGWRQLIKSRCVRILAISAASAAVLVLPVAWSQSAALRKMGFERRADTIRAHSASVSDYLRPSPTLYSGTFYDPAAFRRGKALFPGWTLLALGGAGAAFGLRRSETRRWTLYALMACGLAFLTSLGLNLALGDFRPYELLRLAWPGFADLRSPFRLAFAVHLGLALLAGQCFQVLFERGGRRVAVVLGAVCLLELAPLPARLTLVPTSLAAPGIEGPLVFLPYARGSRSDAYLKTASVMCALRSADVPLVNGYSGYFPHLNAQLKDLLADFPSVTGLRALRDLGVRTLLVEIEPLSADQRLRLEASVRARELRPAGTLAGLRLFELRGARLRPAREYRGGWHVRAAVDNGRIELAAAPAGLGDRFYVVAPGVAALRWRAVVTGPEGSVRRHTLSPAGAQLIHSGARRWPAVSLPAPRRRGRDRNVLEDADTGRELGRAELSYRGR